MRRTGRWTLPGLVALVAASVGCDVFAPNIAAWPTHAVRGALVGVPVDSNLNPFSTGELYDLSSQNVTVELRWNDGSTDQFVSVAAVDVMEVWAAPGTRPLEYVGSLISNPPDPETRAWVAIAVFEVPDDLGVYPPGTTFPLDVTVHPLRDGEPIAAPGAIMASLRILDEDFGHDPLEALAPRAMELEPPPLLRVVGVAGPGSFDPTWFDGNPGNGELRIGSVEFELQHPGAGPEAVYATGQAASGVALLGPGSTGGRTRVLLAAPEGFRLPPENASTSQAGDGPFLDLHFAPGTLFVPGDFEVLDLRVTDLDGNEILYESDDAVDIHVTLYARGAE